MVARPASPYRSANAGEFSRDAKGRVDIKQYYSAGLAYKNIEPVPQSGFRQMGGTWRKGTVPGTVPPRYVGLMLDTGTALAGFVTAGRVDFFTTAGHVATVAVAGITEAMLPDLGFYAEGRTIGIFHPELRSKRLFLNSGLANWTVDDWPFDPVPRADLGGDYPQTNDVWQIFIRWSASVPIFLNVTVDGETTPAVPLLSDTGTVVAADAASADWPAFAASVAAALNDLPSLSAGTVTVAQSSSTESTHVLTLSFAGALGGSEFQVSAMIVNTAEASSLAYHIEIGSTEREPLWSESRGWPGGGDLLQDRMAHFANPAVTGALALSQTGEYFSFNIEGQADNAARLDKLRSQTSETILAVKESQFFLIFTDRGAYFVTNRTIERNTPLNFVTASEVAIAANCRPFDLEGTDYYVGRDETDQDDASGHQLLSIIYDDVSTRYNADPVSLLASHLVSGVIRTARQKSSGDTDGSKGWLMRRDGRLIAAQMIRNQDIIGFCEWIAAHGGLVREIGIDGRNRLWLAIERGATMAIELYDTAIYLHDAVTATPDLAGTVSGLDAYEGETVHVVADGYELAAGFAVVDGAINLGDSFASAIVGRWQAPRWESMPQVYVTPNDDVVMRPGRIHTAHLNLIETTSVAVGANGEPAQDVDLLTALDPAGQPMVPKTKLVTVTGEDLPGFMEGTTMVVTQTRPGRLRIRDLAWGAKL